MQGAAAAVIDDIVVVIPILGTGLVAAAPVAIFDSAWRNQPIS